MSDLMKQLNILSWPIWVKLVAAFLVAGLLPLFLFLFIALNSIQDVGVQNIEALLTETAVREARGIEEGLTRASESLILFAENTNNLASLRDVLPIDSSVVVSPINEAELIAELQKQILNTGASPFSQVEVIDTRGELVVQAEQGEIIRMARGLDRTSSAAYLQASPVSQSAQTTVVAVDIDDNDQPLVDVVHILRITVPGEPEPVVLGYLTGRVNAGEVIYANLLADGDFLGGNSRLVTQRGFVIDADGARFEDALLLNDNLFQAALAGEGQIEEVRLDDEALARYYAPISSSPFVLVKQLRQDAVSSQIIGSLVSRVFVLVVGITLLVVVLALLGNQLLASPLQLVRQAIQAMSSGNYQAPLPDIRRGDEIGGLAGDFADMRRRTLDLINNLEARIEARARDVTATREISRVAATQRDMQELMDRVVNLIVERFPNIYHAQIFLLDNDERFAVLRSSTGEAGQQLLTRGHRLAVGSISVIGRVSSTGEMVVERDTGGSTGVHRRNEFLPDTRAELAIPLRVGSRTIGALDVQSQQSDAFTAEQMEVLQTMADQIAVAIENVRLYTESIKQIEQLERTRAMTTLQLWHEYMDNERQQRLESTAGVIPETSAMDQLRSQSLRDGNVVVGNVTDRRTVPVAVPIRLRGQLLGVVEWEVPETDYDENKLLLAQELTNQLALSLENARLFQESQRATVRERLVNEISSSLTAENEVEQIMQTAVREVGKALRSPHVGIRLAPRVNGQQAEMVSNNGDK